jgi:hypothetical protein
VWTAASLRHQERLLFDEDVKDLLAEAADSIIGKEPQAGVGFVHDTFRQGDTSWLIPIGVGADYASHPPPRPPMRCQDPIVAGATRRREGLHRNCGDLEGGRD